MPKILRLLHSIPTADSWTRLIRFRTFLRCSWFPGILEVEPWIRAGSAIELGAPVTERAGPMLQSRVVERALESLTAIVNLSTGITDPRDRASAVQLFEILRNGGERFTPEEVKAWLVGKGGWKAIHAQEVTEVAQKVLERRRLKSGTHRWRPDILNIWRVEAQEERNTSQEKTS